MQQTILKSPPDPSFRSRAIFGSWTSHRLYCGSALDLAAYNAVLAGEKAAAAFTDPPYNVKINGHASGKGKIAHREFPMAAGEMTEAEFTSFLQQALGHLSANCRDGALIYSCMDWRHMGEILAAARGAGLDLLNLCVWAKNNGGMGTLYRSRHELVFVFKNGQGTPPEQRPVGPLRTQSLKRLELPGRK